jgi:membrane-associated phospholipid phosphatase
VRTAVVALILVAAPSPARAEAWHEGDAGKKRTVNLIVASGLGATVLASVVFRSSLQPDSCRWCTPPEIDADIRHALVWDDIQTARRISDIGAISLPVLGLAINLAPVIADGGGTAEAMDVILPIAGALAINQTLTQIAKLAAARTRPAIHFASSPGDWAAEDHVSFFSGHTSFAFAAATSAGMVARQRGSRYETAIWAGGLTIASLVGYLRIAGDKHYASDVLVGAAVGSATGLLVPMLMEHDAEGSTSTTLSADAKTVSFGGTF